MENVVVLGGGELKDEINDSVSNALKVVPKDVPIVIMWIQDGELKRISNGTVADKVWMCEATKHEVMYKDIFKSDKI